MEAPVYSTSENICHSHHLFEKPLCSKLSTLRKIAHIAFHILTLGIPLGLYKWYQSYSNSLQATYQNLLDNVDTGISPKQALSIMQNQPLEDAKD